MALVIKNDQYLSIVDKDFKKSKTGKQVIVDVKLAFPVEFVKASKSGNSKYISFEEDKLAEFLIKQKAEKEHNEPETTVTA